MKVFLVILGLLCTTVGIAQIGIGTTTPDASAKLDVYSTNKGLLPPRVTLTSGADNSTINNPATGLLVYNTGVNAGLVAGYYYWNGSAWATISTSTGSAPIYGDIKTGIQSSDHNGWVQLDGRLKSSLSTTQQTRATTLGIGNNLPDATNAFLVQNGGTLGSISGSNAKTITQSNLPNVTLSGNTASSGAHTHTISFSSTPFNGAWTVTNGSSGYNTSANEQTSTSGTHTHPFSTSSLNGGVTQTTLDVTPKKALQ